MQLIQQNNPADARAGDANRTKPEDPLTNIQNEISLQLREYEDKIANQSNSSS